MPKFKCIRSETKAVPVGMVLEAELINSETIAVTENSTERYPLSGHHVFVRGTRLPLDGLLWGWSEVSD